VAQPQRDGRVPRAPPGGGSGRGGHREAPNKIRWLDAPKKKKAGAPNRFGIEQSEPQERARIGIRGGTPPRSASVIINGGA
jgi:hypothetical protein